MLRTLHRFAAPALILLCFGIAAGQDGYAYKRALEVQEGGWARIVIPQDMYGRLRPDFPDIRIYSDAAMKEIPYVLRKPEANEEQDVEFRIINASVSGKRRFFTFESAGDEVVNTIELRFDRPNYDRRVLLEGSNDQAAWHTIVGDIRIVSIRNELTDYAFGTLRFPDSRYRFFRISFESGEDPGKLDASVTRRTENREAVGSVKVRSFKVNNESVEKSSVLSIRLDHKVPVSAVRLRTAAEADYRRNVEVSYRFGTDKQGRDLFRSAGSGVISSLDDKTVRFPAVLTDELRLVVRNGDSPPLSFSEPEVTGPRYELVVDFPAPGTYFLYYSHPDAPAPEYDLAPFAAKAGSELPKVSAGPEAETGNGPGESAAFESSWWLLPIMGAIVVLMLIFAYRLIRKGS